MARKMAGQHAHTSWSEARNEIGRAPEKREKGSYDGEGEETSEEKRSKSRTEAKPVVDECTAVKERKTRELRFFARRSCELPVVPFFSPSPQFRGGWHKLRCPAPLERERRRPVESVDRDTVSASRSRNRDSEAKRSQKTGSTSGSRSLARILHPLEIPLVA